jgi:hypothetical protein
MGKNAPFRLENGLTWLQTSVCLLENCLFEPFLYTKSGSRPMDTVSSSYFINSERGGTCESCDAGISVRKMLFCDT